MKRRDLLGMTWVGLVGAGLGGAGARLAAAAAATPRQGFFARHHLPIGLQLYTLDPNLEHDFEGTLAAVQAIGYRTVELAGLHGRSATEFRQALDAHELRCLSLHVPGEPIFPGPNLQGDLDALAVAAHTLGASQVVMPLFLMPQGFKAPAGADMLATLIAAGSSLSGADYRRMAEFLNDKGRKLRQRGLRLGYHNHNFEFRPLPEGGFGLQILLRETDPDLVSFEMDAGWVCAAGHDPLQLLAHHPGRFTQMHVKDIKASTRPNYALQQDPTEVGSGAIHWRQILPAAHAAGVRNFFVEQEPPYAGERLDAVAKSYRYLSGLKS